MEKINYSTYFDKTSDTLSDEMIEIIRNKDAYFIDDIIHSKIKTKGEKAVVIDDQVRVSDLKKLLFPNFKV